MQSLEKSIPRVGNSLHKGQSRQSRGMVLSGKSIGEGLVDKES